MSQADAQLSTLDGLSGDRPSGASAASTLPMLTVLSHPNLQRVGERALLMGLARGGTVNLSRLEPEFTRIGAATGEPLLDQHVSRNPLKILRLGDGRVRFDRSETPLRVAIDGEPLDGPRDFDANALERGLVVELAERIVLLLHEGEVEPAPDDGLGFVGESVAISRLRRDVRRLTDLDITTLIVGETGVGKELVARAIHNAGPRATHPFIPVNIGAIPPSLAGAELFGCERGAYTGALRARPGHFAAAGSGTLFLDEIGEAPLDVQAILLRALDDGEVQTVGAPEPRRIKARIIAATDVDLEERVARGVFRAALLHRLATFTLVVPPLRARRDDIGRLIAHFLKLEIERTSESASPAPEPVLPATVVSELTRYDWPGNVRQLRNVVRQLVVQSRGAKTFYADAGVTRLLSRFGGSYQSSRADAPPSEGRERNRKPNSVTESELVEALRASRWDLKNTAERLGISRTSLYALVEAKGVVRLASELDPGEIARCHKDCDGDINLMVERLEVSRYALSRRMRELRLGPYDVKDGRDVASPPTPIPRLRERDDSN